MIDVQEIIEAAREGVAVDTRITEVEHPDTPEGEAGPAVIAALSSTCDGDSVTHEVRLAEDIMAALDARLPGPRRREGTVTLHDVHSFCEYLSRYQVQDSSVVYADIAGMTFAAVLDEHPVSVAREGAIVTEPPPTRWRGFRAVYTCPRSPEWKAWTSHDGEQMKQEAFADFLEERLEDMVAGNNYPKPIEVLAVARQLHIRTKGTFQREINPTNGDYILVNKTETETGSTEIPRAFGLAIPVFEGGERYAVEARVRFAIGNSGPAFSYTLHRRSEIERDAFTGVRNLIANTTKLPVLLGKP